MYSLVIRNIAKTLDLPADWDITTLDYDNLYEYQLRTQYNVFEPGQVPLILTSLVLDEKGSKIVLLDDMTVFKENMHRLLTRNIDEVYKVDCLKASYIGSAREKSSTTLHSTKPIISEIATDGNVKDLANNIVEGFKVKVIGKVGNVDEFVQNAMKNNEKLVDNVFMILNVFMDRIKDFNFIFAYKLDKLKATMKNSRSSFDDIRKQMLNLKKAREDMVKVFLQDRIQCGIFLIDVKEIKK